MSNQTQPTTHLLTQLEILINQELENLNASDRIYVYWTNYEANPERNIASLKRKNNNQDTIILKDESFITMHTYLAGFLHALGYVTPAEPEPVAGIDYKINLGWSMYTGS